MEKILESLYDQFYEKPKLAALQASVEANHNLLRQRLGKPERKLVLRLIDDETATASPGHGPQLEQDRAASGPDLDQELT